MKISKEKFENLIKAYIDLYNLQNTDYKYIAIDCRGDICVFEEKPIIFEDTKQWDYKEGNKIKPGRDLFPCIMASPFDIKIKVENWQELCFEFK